jgi:cysteine desulfuration protein SufE
MSFHDNPFGTSITVEDILDTLSFFDTWEERYKYIIDLGKEIPSMDDSVKTTSNLVRGCQSQVWINVNARQERLFFEVDSDAFIVKGLLGLVLAAYNGRTKAEILDFDIEQYFEQLGLLKHLSPTRGNGLRAMVARVQAEAQNF